ncbi:MAG: adventurous gliding motility protein CglF, partial [Myxococcaceae bacterium]|nr:adventurous gliding motility protein CglF [Myxococcaceae bacterium]
TLQAMDVQRVFGGLMSKQLWLVIVAISFAASALAQDKKGGDNVSYKKQTEYSFEDDTIEGDLTKPDGEYVEARKKVKHSNLIKIREEFKDKVMQSVGEL